jgi:hypothetical protein
MKSLPGTALSYCFYVCCVQCPTHVQLSHKLSHTYTFWNYCIILRELVINALPSYTRISNAPFLTISITLCVITIGTEEYSLAQQYLFKLIKPCYMFQLYSHHQTYLQSLVELYMLNVYAMWGPSSEAKNLHAELKKTWTIQWVKNKLIEHISSYEESHYAACGIVWLYFFEIRVFLAHYAAC